MQLRSKRKLASPEPPGDDDCTEDSAARGITDDTNGLLTTHVPGEPKSQQTEFDAHVDPTSRPLANIGHDAHPGSTITRIETIMEILIDQLSHTTALSIEFTSRRSVSQRNRNQRQAPVQFPGRRLTEAKKFARLLLILQLSHSALVSGIVLTKRNIFYQHQELFESQRNVDELVDDVASMLSVTRDALNIAASSKGIMVGSVLLELTDGTTIDMSACPEGTLIPMSKSIQFIDILSARWLLVIEKDAIFQSLASARYWETGVAGRQGILVTAKGYPDLNTRTFLRLIRSKHPLIPTFVLTDFDPDGVSIYSCYRYGSKALAHETQANNLLCSWIGIQMEHILHSSGATQSSGSQQDLSYNFTSTAFNESCTHLTPRDRNFAAKAIKRSLEHGRNEDYVTSIGRQLQLMLMLGIKVEIQGLDENGNLAGWLDHEIECQLFGPER